jgi:hypothetical protein
VLIVVINVQFHLFQKLIDPFTAVIVLEKTNQMTLVMIDHPETTEVQEISEITTEVQDTLEITTEVQDTLEITTEKIQL